MSDDDYCTITTDNTAITTTTGSWWEYYATPNDMPQEPVVISTPFVYPTPLYNNKKGDDDMHYLYEVILVNPKHDTFYVEQYIARSETSVLMEVYNNSQFKNSVPFDDLKTSCRILMEWKKKESLKKAIETIKKAVE